MCGIVGEFSGSPDPVLIEKMMNRMVRRGPDDSGLWTENEGCVLGFRRLAILDLSPTGKQPMMSADERYVMVFNGEIYNFRELRRGLEQEGMKFRSTGDSEVLLNLLIRRGVQALSALNGMFALALYDRQERSLLLARDRMGIKPLYYMRWNGGILFGSQYDLLLMHPRRTEGKVNLAALSAYMELGYIPAPLAVLDHTFMLEAGTWLSINAVGESTQGRYYAYPQFQEPDLFGESANEAVAAAVGAAVKRQLVSDVRVGTFLSGGVDSPLVAAHMARTSAAGLQAFTIKMQGIENDESEDASAFARELGLKHEIEEITPQFALDNLEQLFTTASEPLADYSIIPTFLVSQMARRHATVVLSGDGGDELFWGYSTRFSRILRSAPAYEQPFWMRTARYGVKRLLHVGVATADWKYRSIGQRHRAAQTFMPRPWIERILPALAPAPYQSALFDYNDPDQDHTAQWLRWNEVNGHLSRVLLKVDRASMYNSLEVRVPLLDNEVLDVSARVDWRSCLDIDQEHGKLPLRAALRTFVQHQTHGKKGFHIPIIDWCTKALRPLLEDTLLTRRTILDMPINSQALRRYYQDFLTGHTSYSVGIWTLLMLSQWEDHIYKKS